MSVRLALPKKLLQKRFNSFSFIPNSDVFAYEEKKLSREIDDSVLPKMPDVSLIPKLYTDMVDPRDVVDLFIRPKFEDVVVTALAKDSPLFGDPTYSLLSRSHVNGSKFLFASLTTEWMDIFRSGIKQLSEITPEKTILSYNSKSREATIHEQFHSLVLHDYTSLSSFYEKLLANDDITLENVTHFLLHHIQTLQDYQLIMKYLSNNIHAINTFASKDFVTVLLDDLLRSISVERVDVFSELFTNYLLAFQPNLLKELSPTTLDRLAYVMSASSDLSTAIEAMVTLINVHENAPLKPTFELFMSRYCKLAYSQDYSKSQILNDLGNLKSIFFHRGLDTNAFKLFLNAAVNNVHDLSHLLSLVEEKSPGLLNDHAPAIFERLQSIHQEDHSSKLIKAVQVTQLAKIMINNGVKANDTLKDLLSRICADLDIPRIHL